MSRAPRWAPPPDEAVGPLAGYRVLDLSAFAVGPWAAALLASLGADVVKIDPPYGDHIRRVKPSRHGEATTYTVCNLGKRSIELDLKNPAHRAMAYELVAECDVLVENSREGAMERLGFGYDTVSEINPGLVYCSSSSFGSSGPLATVGSTDPQGQAFSGFVSIQGDPGTGSEFLRYFAAIDLGTSACLVQAVLAGLYWRNRTGRGSVIKTSQMEGALAMQATKLAEHLGAGATPQPMGSASTEFVPSEAFRCRDSQYLAVSTPDDASWRRLCAALDLSGLAEDPRFATNHDRVANRAELVAHLRERFQECDCVWWRGRLRDHQVPHATALALDELMRGTGPALTERFLVELAHPVSGTIRTVRPPWRFDRTPATQRVAPLPGQHNEDFLRASVAEPGTPVNDDRPVRRPSRDGDAVARPLQGVRVLEYAQGIPGPYCGLLLRALGAEVTKVEPSSGDYSRNWAPVDAATGDSALFGALNRDKRGVRLDGDCVPDGLGVPDVVIVDATAEEFGIRDVERFLADQVARGAVVCRLSSAGSPDPGGAVVADHTELEVQALAGLTRYVGTIGEAPVRVGADLAMTLCGAFGVQGVLAGLLERQSSGRGQIVDVSALGAMLSIMTVMVAALDDPAEWTGFHCLAAAYPRDHGVPTADGAISFSAPRRSDDAWFELCRELGAGALAADERYRSDAQRTPRSKELNRELAKYTASLPTATVLEATHRHGGLGVAVQTYAELFGHAQVKAMDVCDTANGYTTLGAPWRINGSRPHIAGRAPRLGEHDPDPSLSATGQPNARREG